MKLNVSWAFAGNAAYAACQWLVFVLLVRSLPLADVGRFAFGVALLGPIFLLANLRLRNLVATGISSPHGFADYLAARLLMMGAAVCVSVAVGAWLSSDSSSLALLALLAVAKACDGVADICHGLFQRELDMRSAAISLMMNGFLSVVLVAATVAAWPGLQTAAAAYAAGSALTLTNWDLRRVRNYLTEAERRLWSPGTLRAVARLVQRATPLGLASGLGSLQVNIPRYAVAAWLGPAALAVFTALAYLTTLGNLVANATAQAALPLLTRDLRTSPAQYRKRLRNLVQIGVVLGVATLAGTVLLAQPAVDTLYGGEVANHPDLLVWLMTAAALSYAFLFLGTASTARMRFGAQLLISAAGTLAVAGSVVPLVSRHGLLGAAYALCAGALVEGAAYAVLTVRDFKSQVPPRGLEHAAVVEA